MRNTIALSISAVGAAVCSIFSHSQAQENEPVKAGEFSFTYEKPWVRQAVTSRLRAAQLIYKQSDEKLKNVEVVVSYFGARGGGGVEANIERWKGQFSGEAETKTEKKKVNGREIIYFTGKGTFQESVGGPFSGNKTARPDYTMLAAILPSQQGPVFLKMTGPHESVAAAKDAFIQFAESALQTKKG